MEGDNAAKSGDSRNLWGPVRDAHTHTHTDTHTVYDTWNGESVRPCVYVCVYVCVRVQVHLGLIEGRCLYVVWPLKHIRRIATYVPEGKLVSEDTAGA